MSPSPIIHEGSVQWWLEELAAGRVPKTRTQANQLRSLRALGLLKPHPSLALTENGRRYAESRAGIE